MSEYKASQQLVRLTCISCGRQVEIDGEDQSSVQAASSWIMIFPATSTDKVAACDQFCAIEYLEPKRKIEIIPN